MILCLMCGREYDVDQSAGACASCTLLTQGCGKVKCPNCGYENQRPLRDALVMTVDRWRGLLGFAREKP